MQSGSDKPTARQIGLFGGTVQVTALNWDRVPGVQVALAERDRHAGEVLPLGEQHPVWPGRGDGEGVLAVEGDPEARPAKPAQIKTWIDGLDSQGEGSGRLPAAARQSAWASAPNASLGSQPSPSYPVPAPPGSIFTTP